MINKNEIMVGCWVEYDGKYYQIDTIASEFPTLNTAEFGIGVVDWNNINGIPITEEILVKAGDTKWLLSDCEGYYVLINNKKIRIKFVHSLQNIFLCIEQKELDICL